MEAVTKPGQDVLPVPQKHGQGVRALVEARHRELELELSAIKKGAPGKSADLEAALAALKALMTGNLDQIPPTVAQELIQWIETSKYLGTTAAAAKPVSVPSVKDGPSLRALIEARHHQLELSEANKSGVAKSSETETALGALKALMTGNLDLIPPSVAEEFSHWMEKSPSLVPKASPTEK
jgi:hypothetical protein